MSLLEVPSLVERDGELAVIGEALADVERGSGSVIFVEALAGHGKTAVLRSVRAAARQSDLPVLSAVGAEIERDFSYGVVRQLLEPALRAADEPRRSELFADSSGLARGILDSVADTGAGADACYGRLHALFSLTVNLAGGRPLVFIVDDLHWVDAPSLRFLDVLARRIEDLPALLAVAARPAEPGAMEELLDSLAASPAARVLRPRALSPVGIETLLAGALGEDVQSGFVAAAAELTSGSPLLVNELVRALVDEGFSGRDDEVERLRETVPGNLTRSVVARLRRLSPHALAVARSVAVLGERRRVAEIAALAEVPEAAVAEAHVTLARVGLLDSQRLRFLHPLVRSAVHADLVGSEQARWHQRAAALLAAGDADPGDIASHLLFTEPGGEPWVVDVLVEVAGRALADGAPEIALRQLQRALAEPPAPRQRQSLLVALGRAEARRGVPGAAAHLEEAAAGEDPDLAVQADRLLAKVMVTQARPADAADVLRRALDVARSTHPDAVGALEDDLVDVLAHQQSYPEEYRRRLESAAADDDASPTLLAHLAFARAISGAPADQVLQLARRAVAPRADQRRFTHFYAFEALMIVEAADEARAALREVSVLEKRFGGRVVSGPLTYMPSARAAWERAFGDLEEAERQARYAIDLMTAGGVSTYATSLRGTLACVLLDRGRVAEADEVMELLPAEETGGGITESHAHRARLRLLQGRNEEALAEIERELERERARGWAIGNRADSRNTYVRVLAALGRVEEARDAARAEVELSRRRGVAGAEARARLGLAAVMDGGEATEELRAAVEAARRSPALRLRAEALLELGSALRRAGERAEARPALAEARELARRSGATGLEERAHEELMIAGARPQRLALSGLESLTAAERRVADMAAEGMKNRDIAAALFVTLKTVEVHLGHTYAKLGIKGRSQLPAALAGTAGARP